VVASHIEHLERLARGVSGAPRHRHFRVLELGLACVRDLLVGDDDRDGAEFSGGGGRERRRHVCVGRGVLRLEIRRARRFLHGPTRLLAGLRLMPEWRISRAVFVVRPRRLRVD
jgi:hypothetical protein